MESAFSTLHYLVVDDEPNMVLLIKNLLEDAGCNNVHGFSSPKDAIKWSKTNQFHIALIDYKMKEMSGLDLTKNLQERFPDAYFVLITAYAELKTSIEALRLQIFDLLQKPLKEEDLVLVLERIIKHMELRKRNTILQSLLQEDNDEPKLLGKSKAIKMIRDKIELFANHYEPVLITGETGVGKEVVARMLHSVSQRRNNSSFVAVNCSAFPDTLLESELFGHEKGAFTGADSKRTGKLEFVGSGTILLDEVCEIPPQIQVKLLRVLQEKEFERVGGNNMIKVKARVISATNRDLEEAMEDNLLRKDFYYRLNNLLIHIPPLRERKIDIEYLGLHFLRKQSLIHNKPISRFSDSALNIMLHHAWPGNVRQLQGVIDYAVLCCDQNEIQVEHMPIDFVQSKDDDLAGDNMLQEAPDSDTNIPGKIENFEREMIVNALQKHRWNRTKAAKTLGFSRTQMFYRLKKYNIS